VTARAENNAALRKHSPRRPQNLSSFDVQAA
jgi:hypothetical protein